MQMKYLMYQVAGMDHPILFSAEISHVDMHKNMGPYGKLVSAGFVTAQNCAPRAYGSSTTLAVRSRTEDSAIVRRHLGWEE